MSSSQKWGVVCDMDWDLSNADVVCKELKFGPALRVPTGSKYGECEGNCPKWLSRVKCFGFENKIESCDHGDWGNWDCRNVGMVASVECSDSGRINNRMLVGGRVPWEGRLVVENAFGELGYVCRDASFQRKEADVACKSLGYSGAIEIVTQGFAFLRSYLPTVMNNIKCNGEEESLWDCQGAPSKYDQFPAHSVPCAIGRFVSLRCDVKSAIKDDWEVCNDSFCDCNKDEKTVTCPNVLHEYAVINPLWFFPSNAETLKFRRSQLESRGNFQINENFYKMLTKNTGLKTIEIDAKEQVNCLFNYDARRILTIYNRKPDNTIDAFKKKTYTPPDLKALPAGGIQHCFIKPKDEDVCTEGFKCYRHCETPLYLNALETTVRALNLDTQKVRCFYQDLANLTIFDAESVKNVVIYAQTVYLNTEFKMPRENMKIVTRHFEMGPDAEIKNGDKLLTDCTQGIYISNQRYYLSVTGSGNAKIEIWAESVNLKWKLQNCKLLQQGIPGQVFSDDYSLSSTLTCAKHLHRKPPGAHVSNETKAVIEGMVKYVKTETLARISKTDKPDSFYASVYTDAGEYLEGLHLAESTTDEQVRFVPWLSAEMLSEISETWAKLLENTDKQLKGELNRKDALVAAREAVSRSDNQLKGAIVQAEATLKSIELLKEKYNAVKSALEEKRKIFEAAIRKKIEEERAKKSFAVIKAVVGFIGSVLSAEADPASGILDALRSLKDLVQALLEVYQMVKDVESWMADQKSILESIVDPSKITAAVDYENKVKFIDHVATMTVSIGAWEKMKVVANVKLDTPIDGAADYRIALNEVAIYGKLLTLETVRNAKQARRVLELKSHVRSHEVVANTIDSSLNWENPDEVADWTRKQAFKQKEVVADVVKRYCEAYFYSRFHECVGVDYVLPADSLPDIEEKIGKITLARLTSTSGFCAAPSRYEHKVIEIQDEKRINEFKATKVLKVSLNEVRDLFENSLERNRLRRIEVWLLDVTSSGEHDELAIKIFQTGVFYDVFRHQQYAFTSEKPTSLMFKYKPRNKVITRHPEIDPDFAQEYMNPTPLGDWTISVPPGIEDNDKMKFDGLTKIEVKFSGTSIDCTSKKKYML